MRSLALPETSRSGLRPYQKIARVDHWFKNLFMLLGVVVASFYEPERLAPEVLPVLVLALLATCVVASSNYVLNELLDARYDREHPEKRSRPVAAGQVHPLLGLVEWGLLGALGLGLATRVGWSFGFAALALWGMGVVYNLPPLRTKELPYLDVISESVNNPIRLLLGWFAIVPDRLPPLSLMLAYWALGAFYMAAKRFAELRHLGDRSRAARYRRSFGHYTEARLLVSMLFYASSCAFLGGIFIVRCKLELVLLVPLIAGHLTYYLALALEPDSPVQAPERLHRRRGFLAYSMLTFVVFMLLMFTSIPGLHDLFAFEEPPTPSLWTLR